MSKPLNERRPELRLPCERPERPRLVLERMAAPKTQAQLGRINGGLGVAAVIAVLLFAAWWLLRQLLEHLCPGA